MKRGIKLTENDLTKLVKKIINENKAIPSLDTEIGSRFIELMQVIKQYEQDRINGNYEQLNRIIPMVKFRLGVLERAINELKDMLPK